MQLSVWYFKNKDVKKLPFNPKRVQRAVNPLKRKLNTEERQKDKGERNMCKINGKCNSFRTSFARLGIRLSTQTDKRNCRGLKRTVMSFRYLTFDILF